MPGLIGRRGARRRARRRTAVVVGGAAYAVGKRNSNNSDQGQEVNDEEYEEEPQATSPAADPMAEIEKLGELHSKGILTDEEFEAKKSELLKQI